jgi:hypothetical protein
LELSIPLLIIFIYFFFLYCIWCYEIARKRKSKNTKRNSSVFGQKIPIAGTLGLLSGLLFSYNKNRNTTDQLENTLSTMTEVYTGVNPITGEFNFRNLQIGLFPLVNKNFYDF